MEGNPAIVSGVVFTTAVEVFSEECSVSGGEAGMDWRTTEESPAKHVGSSAAPAGAEVAIHGDMGCKSAEFRGE